MFTLEKEDLELLLRYMQYNDCNELEISPEIVNPSYLEVGKDCTTIAVWCVQGNQVVLASAVEGYPIPEIWTILEDNSIREEWVILEKTSQVDNAELPGMWEKADFTGGETE